MSGLHDGQTPLTPWMVKEQGEDEVQTTTYRQVTETVYKTDPLQEALTGRTLERIEEENRYSQGVNVPTGQKNSLCW